MGDGVRGFLVHLQEGRDGMRRDGMGMGWEMGWEEGKEKENWASCPYRDNSNTSVLLTGVSCFSDKLCCAELSCAVL